ncbi:hypothetical protein [Paludibacterium paludis]|uniref:Uncharacterized protein n=1 Tax=Paludibacterium paludis TaxID=1225769 RepID=A0A918P6D7_9NEIS|nr:hypothetical protein [Paludibacterium paludis]GGY25637.1 hypothetical protein GCM10011289_31580 [Paludibacterium paludis]
MYLILIGWLYVVLMIAAAQDSVAKGLSVAFFLGFLPSWLFLRLIRRKLEQRRRVREESRREA